MRILVAEDDEQLCENIVRIFKRENYSVDSVFNGQDAIDYVNTRHYDVLVLDWMMPKVSGIEVCKHVRNSNYEGGILIVTARDNTEDIINGLDSGADDYMIKPFKVEELLARIRALLRRKNKAMEQIISYRQFKLNKDTRQIFRNDIEIHLTKNEFLLLEYLFSNQGRVLTREQIFEYIWGMNSEVSNNALDALVRLVRKKIDENNSPSYIKNVRGVGYILSYENDK